ncbi:unnamed protein product [Mytilus edulis]|uniref:C2H2-type domain-containing protein n=1 Tax=Mytilus edulis TaxID=6550 RepID=A0A8S3T8W1_MYTED|nr:unnamed protein product [Mytilus edulis]
MKQLILQCLYVCIPGDKLTEDTCPEGSYCNDRDALCDDDNGTVDPTGLCGVCCTPSEDPPCNETEYSCKRGCTLYETEMHFKCKEVIIPFSNFVADHHGRVVLARNNIDVEHENMGNDNDTENNGNENVTETVEKEMEEDVSNDGLFACPDQSCTKVFTKPHFLEAHIVIGNHVYSTSENSYDSVKLIWAQQCGAVDREHKVLIQSVSSINMNVNEGWALKLNKPFKRFTKRRRPNFDTLATELKTTRHENDGTKMFTREEWLSSSQIRSLFANFVRLGAETSLKSEDTAVIENVLEEIDSLEYHNNMTELATDVVQQFL